MMPWLDYLFERNPIRRIGPPGWGPFLSFCTARLTARVSGSDDHDPSKPDMLDGFLEARKDDPPAVRNGVLMAYVGANVGAGADTVTAELCTVMYHLGKHPESMKKLQAELDSITPGSISAEGTVSWAQCQELAYLGACVNEGLRIFPGAGLPLEKRVGPSGLVVPTNSASGQVFLPEGTNVGMNPYVINRDRGVFGEDANSWRPERWLQGASESESGFQERLSRMKQALLSFGAGKRGCIGRNIALMESHKVIASMLRAFDVELVDPRKEWKTHCAFIVRVEGIEVKLRKRR